MSAETVANRQPRCRARLRREVTPAGARDVPMATAIAVFKDRTGVDPNDDQELACVMTLVLGGLTDFSPKSSGRGHPRMPDSLALGLKLLVDRFGPTDAALALVLFKLHGHENFPTFIRRRNDVGDLLRGIAQRLDQIRRRAA